MKTIDLATGTLLVISEDDPFVVDDPYSYRLLGHPSEITGEVWGKILEHNGLYEYPDFSRNGLCLLPGPTQSGLSLIAAHNIKDTDVLLFKPKNS